MLLSSLGNVLVSRIRMFNLELSRNKEGISSYFVRVRPTTYCKVTDPYTNFIYHIRPANYSHQHYRKFHLYWSASRSYLGALIFSFSYPCDHQRTIELGHRSCVQLFTSLDESGAACLCVFLCRAAAAMWQYAYSSVTSYRRTRCQTWGLAMAGKSSGGTDTSLLFSECLIYSTC